MDDLQDAIAALERIAEALEAIVEMAREEKECAD